MPQYILYQICPHVVCLLLCWLNFFFFSLLSTFFNKSITYIVIVIILQYRHVSNHHYTPHIQYSVICQSYLNKNGKNQSISLENLNSRNI